MTRNGYILIFLGLVLLVVVLVVPFFVVGPSSRPARERAAPASIFKSIDSGISWAPSVKSSEVNLALPSNILSFVFDPVNPAVIYLGAKGGGLWISKNSGESWARVLDANEVLKPLSEVYDIAVSPVNPQVLYLAVFQDNRGRVMRSIDGGISFQQVYAVPIDRFGVFAVAADSARANQVYMVTGQGGFFVSSDGGITWRVQKWFPDGLVRLLKNPSGNGQFFALTSRGEFYRTDDAGESWFRLTPGYSAYPGAAKIHDLVLDPSNPAVLYSVSEYGLLRSEDAGSVWRPVRVIIPPESLPMNAVGVDPKNSARIFVGIRNQLYRSDDFGDHWQIIGVPTDLKVLKIRFSPADSRVVFAVVGR